MAIRDIEILGSQVLRTPATDVDVFDDALSELVEDMFETMYHAEGVGLAGPQVGVSLRVFVVDVHGHEDEPGGRYALVNPRIVRQSRRTERTTEGCLSIPGMEEVVERPYAVVVEALDLDGDPVRIEASGLLARALQHEYDHLDGVLFFDRISPLKRRMLLKKWKKSREEADS